MRKILLFAAAAICSMSLNAKTIYLNTGGNDLWGQADPVFFVHSWASEQDNADVKMNHVAGSIFSAEINDGHGNVLFVRMPSGSSALDWNTKWNQTADLTIPDGQNQYNITGWEPNDGNWSTYDPNADPGDNPGSGGGGGGDVNGNEYWYYKGEVDGSNIDNGEGGYNVFKGGTAQIAVENKGYIFLIHQIVGQEGEQFMTDGWLGEDVTHVTMNSCGICNNGNKMYIPAGNHTLYLYSNGDGTVELSREPLDGKTLIGGEGGEGGEGGDDEAIDNVRAELDTNAPMFDVTGRQVTSDYKGVIIQNGHKFIR